MAERSAVPDIVKLIKRAIYINRNFNCQDKLEIRCILMNNGDFIKIEFELRTQDDGKLLATNKEELAKQNDIYNEEMHYGPSVIIVGSDNLLKKVNESFLTAEPDKEVRVEMSPQDAYGERDPKNIKVHTYREFEKNHIDPEVGKEIILNNRRGKVLSVTPGRILVDYNHQWAGKKVVYIYTIKDVLKTDMEKMKALVDMYYSYKSDQFTLEETPDKISITIPEGAKFDAAWMEAKFEIINQARNHIKGKDFVIVEIYEGSKPEEKQPTDEENKEKSESHEETTNVPADEKVGEEGTEEGVKGTAEQEH